MEILRLQDIVSALVNDGYNVDLLVPKKSALLTMAIRPEVNVYTAGKIPFTDEPPDRPSFRRWCLKAVMFLRAYHLLSKNDYAALHGVDDAASIVRSLDRMTVRKYPFIAEFIHPFSSGKYRFNIFAPFSRIKERAAIRHASAVIFSDNETKDVFTGKIPHARVSVLPDPHMELVPDKFTFKDFSTALSRIYYYILRQRKNT